MSELNKALDNFGNEIDRFTEALEKTAEIMKDTKPTLTKEQLEEAQACKDMDDLIAQMNKNLQELGESIGYKE